MGYNDYGYAHVFEKPIEFFANHNDIVFTISSSGRSKNILRAADAALKKGCALITLTGFDENNLLRPLGSFNFYVPSHEYGYVEVIHQYICHWILDVVIEERKVLSEQTISGSVDMKNLYHTKQKSKEKVEVGNIGH